MLDGQAAFVLRDLVSLLKIFSRGGGAAEHLRGEEANAAQASQTEHDKQAHQRGRSLASFVR